MVIFVTIIGITSEYNPFHRGHEYQIRRVRELMGDDCAVVCVMSGNFVQRGEAAIFPKHLRAAAAVECGADLVLELPVPYVLSSAERYAAAAVALFDSLGCVDALCFGSESGDRELLEKTAELLLRRDTDEMIKQMLSTGISYAAARQAAAESIAGRELSILRQRNDILAVEYIKALRRLGSDITPLPIGRRGEFKSASEIRAEDDMLPYLPERARELFGGQARSDMRLIEGAILARLRSMTPEEMRLLPDAGEGLSDRLAAAAVTATDLDSLYSAAATKRYALSRIRRMVMCAFIGIRAGENTERPPYARVLAIGSRGRQVLRRLPETLPVITKPASGKELPLMQLEARATDLYVLSLPRELRAGGQEWKISPFVSVL